VWSTDTVLPRLMSDANRSTTYTFTLHGVPTLDELIA
jgi:hypothetical protein